jgi:flagellum-specific ATP synthase
VGIGERGSITGLYTVLVEGDDMNEPIADTARSILDGHVQLSRALAESNHYPAVDVLGSISRVASSVASPEQIAATGVVRELLAAWRDAKDLVDIDAYVAGTNVVVDRALRLKPHIDAFCQQRVNEPSELESTRQALLSLVTEEAS